MKEILKIFIGFSAFDHIKLFKGTCWKLFKSIFFLVTPPMPLAPHSATNFLIPCQQPPPPRVLQPPTWPSLLVPPMVTPTPTTLVSHHHHHKALHHLLLVVDFHPHHHLQQVVTPPTVLQLLAVVIPHHHRSRIRMAPNSMGMATVLGGMPAMGVVIAQRGGLLDSPVKGFVLLLCIVKKIA